MSHPPTGPGPSDATADRRRLVINFHGIGEPWDGVPEAEWPYWCPRQEWSVMADCLAAVCDRSDVKVEITFDDGNISDVEDALPALIDRDLTATFFVCAGRLGKHGYLSIDDLGMLRAAGMGVGSHGWDHRDLRTVPDAEMTREASDSKACISQAIGEEVTSFALPFGSYNRRVLRHLHEYATVLTSDRMPVPASGRLLPRYSYVQGWGPQQVRHLVSDGTNPAGLWLRRAVLLYKRLR